MSGIINSALAPVGIKPFKGGPYPDAGMGDVAQGSMKKAEPLYGQIAQTGSSLLGPTGREPNSSPVDKLNQTTSNYSSMLNGGPQDLKGLMAQFPALMARYGKAGGVDLTDPNADPYSLDQNQHSLLNQGIDLINGQRATGEQALRAHFAKMGAQENDPRMAAALTRLHANFDNDVNTHTSTFMENARKTKQDTLGNLGSMMQSGGQFQQGQYGQQLAGEANLGNMYGNQISQGAGLLSNAGAGYSGQANQYNQLGQEATARTNQAQANLGEAAGLGAKLWTNLAAKKPATSTFDMGSIF